MLGKFLLRGMICKITIVVREGINLFRYKRLDKITLCASQESLVSIQRRFYSRGISVNPNSWTTLS